MVRTEKLQVSNAIITKVEEIKNIAVSTKRTCLKAAYIYADSVDCVCVCVGVGVCVNLT